MSDAEDYEREEEEEHEEGEETEEKEEQESGNKAPPEEEEELPEEKPFEGEFKAFAGAKNGGDVTIRFSETGEALPTWLKFLVADDYFYFDRVLAGKYKAASLDTADEEGAEGDEAPSSPAAETAEKPEGEDDEAAPASNFDANTKFTLTQSLDEPTVWILSTYIPPVEKNADDEEEGAEGGGSGEAAPASPTKTEAEDGEDGDDEEGDQANDANGDQEAEEAVASVMTIDALTLAAVCSHDCLVRCLNDAKSPSLNLSVFEAWCNETTTDNGDCHALAQLFAALSDINASLSWDKKKRFKMNFDWIFAKFQGGTPVIMSSTAIRVRQLIGSNVVPSGAINPQLLSSVEAVNAYVTLLLTMPRTQLQAWMQPGPPKEGDEEATESPAIVAPFLGSLLLDIRRRAAREMNGKPPLRADVRAAHVALFPKKLETGEDSVVTPAFTQRSYVPSALRLHMSDLALLALSRYDLSNASFAALLERKFAIVREPNDAIGTAHALYFSMDRATKLNNATLIAATPSSYFRDHGLVDKIDWCNKTLASGDEREHFFADHASTFSKLFAPSFLGNSEAHDAARHGCAELAAALRHVEEGIEEFKKTISMRKDQLAPSDPAEADALREELDNFLDRCGAEALCTSSMMKLAADAKNTVSILWLMNQNVTEVSVVEGGTPIDLLQYCLRYLEDTELTMFLVSCGANLSGLWDQGGTSALCFIQEHFSPDVAEELLLQFEQLEHSRSTDPRKKMGVLVGAPV